MVKVTKKSQHPNVNASEQPAGVTLHLCTERNKLKHVLKGGQEAAFYVIKITHHPLLLRSGPVC